MTIPEAKKKMLDMLNAKVAMEANQLYAAIGVEPLLGKVAKIALKAQHAILEIQFGEKEYVIMVPQKMGNEGVVVSWDDLKKAFEALSAAIG